MRNPNDTWEALGSVSEEEAGHVLSKLFTMYEQLIEQDPQNSEAELFFKNLDSAISQTVECNLNRR